MRKLPRIALAILVGCVIAAIPAILQPYFKAGTIPDLACELILLPGRLIASPFHDRGTASLSSCGAHTLRLRFYSGDWPTGFWAIEKLTT
jgi:hypothetical protein